jgi:iron complex outermembrane receptor protein
MKPGFCLLFRAGSAALALPSAGQAWAQPGGVEGVQPPPASAAAAAIDAFGERVGIDQAGLYGESQSRGFDLLASSGAFRIDGFYFSPAATPSESLLAGSTIRVGIASTALDLPSPSGVIAYRLRDPGTASTLSVTTGLRDQESWNVELLGTAVSRDQEWGIVGHALIVPDQERATGEDGRSLNVATVARWRPDARTSLRLFGAFGLSRHDGEISVTASGDGVPPPLRAGRKYSPDWARTRLWTLNAGAILERSWNGWSLGASAIRSVRHADRSDVALLEIDRDGNVDSTVFFTPPVETRSDSAEARIARTFTWLGAHQRIGLALRQRRTLTERAFATPFDAGRFTLADGPADVPEPALPEAVARGQDEVDQRIASLSYGLQLADRLQVRLGAHHNRYVKTVLDFEGRRSRQLDTTWLYNGSAIWGPTRRLRLFASYVTGLEESGVAPTAATNRGEVLPPVEAEQYELGASYDLAPGLSFILAGFDINKPIYGLRQDGRFDLVGRVRHRGIEASLTGRLTERTRIVVGANLVRPRLSGTLVDAGLAGRVAPGVSRFNATLSLEQQLGAGWSADFYLLYEGRRRRDSASTVEVRSVPFTTLGLRYSATIGPIPVTLRGQLVNVIDRRGYWATPSGPLVAVPPRTFRLLLTAHF